MRGTTALPYGWVSCPVFSGATLFGGFGSGLLLLICSMDFFCPPRNPPFAMGEPPLAMSETTIVHYPPWLALEMDDRGR